MKPEGTFRKLRTSIFWRIYLHSVILLLAVALGIAGLLLVIEKKPPRHGAPIRQAKMAAAILLPSLDDREQLRNDLNIIRRSLDMSISVYGGDGTRIASAGPSPPPSLLPSEVGALSHQKYFHHGTAFYAATLLDPLSPKGAYLVMGELTPSGLTRIVSALVFLFILLALASLPLSRAIARPLERLTATAGRLSGGDLGARSGLKGEGEIGLLAGAIDTMASRLERQIRREKELLGNIAHEIRTPLSRIRVALELCEEDAGGAEKIDARLRGIGSDLAELERLVEDVLVATRLDLAGSEGMVLRKKTVDLPETVEAAAGRFAENHPGHELRRTVPADVPALEADPVLLRRVMDNVLDNAAKYSGRARPVELEVDFDEREVAVEVRDRGPGIEEEDLSRVFDPFFRAEGRRESGAAGVGLGLALCRRIVDAHGGTIAAGRHPGGGTIVRFTFPRMVYSEKVRSKRE